MDGTGRVMGAEEAEILATEIWFVVVSFVGVGRVREEVRERGGVYVCLGKGRECVCGACVGVRVPSPCLSF